MDKQYSLKKILAIWLLSAVPMAVLAFVITPILTPKIVLHPGLVFWMVMDVGLIWQFVLSLLVLKTDGYDLKWSSLRERMWYQKPKNPNTGKTSNRLFLWAIPFLLLSGFLEMIVDLSLLENLLSPLYQNLPLYDLQELTAFDFKGAWWLLGLALVSILFNYFLGEEFLYRGILLPKMKGVFGKWDWFANGVLFGLYHLHKPQVIMSTMLTSGFIFSFPSKYFQSNWMAVIIHGVEGIFVLIIVLGLILGLA